jgi:hypothetical protein
MSVIRIVQEDGWNIGIFWTSVEKRKSLAPVGIQALKPPEGSPYTDCSILVPRE